LPTVVSGATYTFSRKSSRRRSRAPGGAKVAASRGPSRRKEAEEDEEEEEDADADEDEEEEEAAV